MTHWAAPNKDIESLVYELEESRVTADKENGLGDTKRDAEHRLRSFNRDQHFSSPSGRYWWSGANIKKENSEPSGYEIVEKAEGGLEEEPRLLKKDLPIDYDENAEGNSLREHEFWRDRFGRARKKNPRAMRIESQRQKEDQNRRRMRKQRNSIHERINQRSVGAALMWLVTHVAESLFRTLLQFQCSVSVSTNGSDPRRN